jgi:hypothetical protein
MEHTNSLTDTAEDTGCSAGTATATTASSSTAMAISTSMAIKHGHGMFGGGKFKKWK